jgi:hypothetical protein
MVELKLFVSETLKQILDGVLEAQKYASEHKAAINPTGKLSTDGKQVQGGAQMGGWHPLHPIEFDVVVSSQERDAAQGGVGVFVGAFAIGTKGTTESISQGVSRIRFTIPIALPAQRLP